MCTNLLQRQRKGRKQSLTRIHSSDHAQMLTHSVTRKYEGSCNNNAHLRKRVNHSYFQGSGEREWTIYSHEQIRQHVQLLITGMGLVAEYFVLDYFLNEKH